MLPVYSPESHSLYQDFLISNFLLYYPDPFSISRQTWKIIVQFWHLDLSQTTNILLDSYSKFGPAPRDPVSMLRSYLLSIKLKITSITDWVSRLKECPLYAIISGFSPDDVPGIGTFYDFFLQSPFPNLPFIQAAVPGCFCIAWTHPAFCYLPCR